MVGDSRILGVHGMSMLTSFIVFCDMAVLWFACTVLLDARLAAPKYGWFNFGLMLAGSGMVEAMAWQSLCHALMACNEFIYVY